MQALEGRAEVKRAVLAAVLYAIVLSALAGAQSANVTSAQWWQSTAKGVVDFLKLMLAAAFWGSLGLLIVYGIISWVGPTKFTRLGAMYDLIDTVKGWLLAVFVISAAIVGLVTGFAAITSYFGASADVKPVDVLNDLLVHPIVQALTGK